MPLAGTISTTFNVGGVIKGVYRITNILAGGMGVVYVCELRPELLNQDARHEVNRIGAPLRITTVAIKSYPRETRWDKLRADRFRQEALLWISLAPHPNVVRAFTFDDSGPSPLLFLEYIPGGNLRRQIRPPGLEAKVAIQFALHVCSGMHYLWDAERIIHRDLKPENVLISEGAAKITDFGISSVFSSELASGPGNHTSVTPGGAMADAFDQFAGTPPYVSPEQQKDSSHVSPKSDVYSFGVVLYEMLTGHLPAGTLSDAQTTLAAARQNAPSLLRGTPTSLDGIIQRCLAVDPEQRFESFAELFEALREIALACKWPDIVPTGHRKADINAQLDSHDLNDRAYALMQLGRIEDAGQCYKAALQKDPKDAVTVTGLGTILLHQKRYKQALVYAKKAVRLDPNFSFYYLNLGHAYLYAKQRAKALAAFEEYARREPGSVRGWRTLLILYEEQGDKRNSQRCLARMQDLLPSAKYPACVDILSEAALVEEQAPHAALLLYERAIARFPNDRLAWYNYGVFLHNEKDYVRAAQAYQEARRIAPDFVEALLNLVAVLWSLDRQRAMQGLQQLATNKQLTPHLMPLIESALESPDAAFYAMTTLKAPHLL